MKINNFKKFLESNSELYENFIEALIDSSFGSSFSSMYNNYRIHDPDEDYNMIQDEMDTHGFTISKIKDMFKSEDEFLQILSRLDSQNGYVDIYLYKTAEKLGFNKNLVFLGGEDWSHYILDNPEEAFIRYGYGCHKTKYGRIMMEQAGLTEKDLLKLASKAIEEQLSNNWIDILNVVDIQFPYNAEISDFLFMFGNKTIDEYYFIDDDDRVHIFLSEIANDISSTFDITKRECISKITKNLKRYFKNWNFDVTDDEFVVWLN